MISHCPKRAEALDSNPSRSGHQAVRHAEQDASPIAGNTHRGRFQHASSSKRMSFKRSKLEM